MTGSAQWEVRLREWRESGESAEQFASRHGWKPDVLAWWSSYLERKHNRRAPRAVHFVPVLSQAHEHSPQDCSLPPGDAAGSDSPDKGPVLCESDGPSPSFPQQGLVLELGPVCRVLLQRGFDPVLLRELVHALEDC